MENKIICKCGKILNTSSCYDIEELTNEIHNVRYGKPGSILFEFRGKTYSVPEPIDIMPVGYGDMSKAWALKQIFNDTATEVK